MAMLRRCLNKKDIGYKYYGGRGILVCSRWMKFENFLADMGERQDGLSLERIDGNGNYTSQNCRWATSREQVRNTKATKLTFDKAVRVIELAQLGIAHKEIANQFGIALDYVGKVANGRKWPDAYETVQSKHDERKAEILKRANIDPIRADVRPLSEIMNDYIPFGRWAMEEYLRRRK